MGIKDKRFSSSPSQAVNHELDEIAMRVPRVRDMKNKFRLGFELRMEEGFLTASRLAGLVSSCYGLINRGWLKRGAASIDGV